jgi:glycosyltransferase involved in cell wall biosynthesis
MTAPSISVIISCYNYGRFVDKAIESALAQSYASFEVVVVNDGSTDDSAAVIARYADRIRIVEQANGGCVAAYNSGFFASSGEIVLFLDADDLLAPGALAAVAAAWSPRCAKVQYDLAIIDAEGRDLGRRFCYFDASYDAAKVRDRFESTGTYRWPVTSGNAFARWFCQHFFPLGPRQFPDGTLNTVAPLFGEVRTLPRVLGSYRLHGDNGWSSDGGDGQRLPERISQRRRELELLSALAAGRAANLPAWRALDHELPFLNYRMMAKKLRLSYEGEERDSPSRLFHRACRALLAERLPLGLRLAHLGWFATLTLVPQKLTPALIRVRFNRAALVLSVKQALHARLSRLPGAFARGAL